MTKRVYYFDFLKVIAIFLVCFYHFCLIDFHFVKSQPYFFNIDYLIYSLSSVAVPIFFMVNGALLLTKNYSYKSYLNKALKLFILLTIWKFINVLAMISIKKITGYTAINFVGLLFSNSFPNVDLTYLWFIVALIAIYLIAPILKYLYDNNLKLLTYILIVVSCFSFIFVLFNTVLQTIEWKSALKIGTISYIDLSYSNPFGVYSYAILYFVLGGLLYKKLLSNEYQKIKSPVLLLSFLIGWVSLTLWGVLFTNINNSVYDSVFSGYPTPMTFLMAISVFILFSRINISNKSVLKCCEIVSNNTLGIYLIHWVIGCLYISSFYLLLGATRMKVQNVIHAIFLLLISLLLSIIISKIPVMRRLIKL